MGHEPDSNKMYLFIYVMYKDVQTVPRLIKQQCGCHRFLFIFAFTGYRRTSKAFPDDVWFTNSYPWADMVSALHYTISHTFTRSQVCQVMCY